MEGDSSKKTVTWLHLSDLHLCNPKSGWEADYILEKLRDDFTVLQKKDQLKPDLIFFTGDVVYGHLGEEGGKPMDRQYRDAAIFFDEMRRSFDPEIPRDRLFFVPGNHDVKRSKGREYLRKGFDAEMPKDEGLAVNRLNELLQKKEDDWMQFIEGLADYCQFLDDKGYSHLLEDRERLIYAVIREVNGVNVGIAGLNSAWSSYKNGEKDNLWLGGHWQVQELSRQLKSVDLKIALMHHPFNWFQTAEDPKVKRELQNHFRFFLHGHEHMGWIEVLEGGFVRISAGACYGDSEEEMGYNMMQLDVGTGKCKVWLRKYDATGEGWGPRFIHGKTDESGIREIDFGARQESIKKKAPKPVVPGLDSEPDSPESRGVFGRRKEIGDIAKELTRTPIVGIYGMAGIGKSRIIQEVMRTPQHREKSYVTCFAHRQMGLEEMFRQLARALGCRDEEPKADFSKMFGGGYDFSILKTYAETADRPVVIHLVDGHYLFRDYKWRDEGIRQFLEAIPNYYPEFRIIMESRIALRDIFPREMYRYFRIGGINRRSMALYFQQPFINEPSVGWNLSNKDSAFIFERLGGRERIEGAQPLAMMLLANVARGVSKHPAAVLGGYEQQKFVDMVEKSLFNDLYNHALNSKERHMLRLCAHYRERIPDAHVGRLDLVVEEEGVFMRLVSRCLLNPAPEEEWYLLHTIIGELTRKRMDKKNDEYYADHETIADAWLAQLKVGDHPSLPNIRAANEAFYHLAEGENYERFYELSDKLLYKINVVPELERMSRKLSKERKHKDDRNVLRLLVKLVPGEPKYHRFLAQTIEKLEGRGHEEALTHYKRAFELAPIFPAHLTDYAKCLLGVKRMREVISLVEGFDKDIYRKVMDNHNIAIYTGCLEEAGQGEKASVLRMEQINKNSKTPVFYNDEANYLLKKGKYTDALRVVAQAEERGCANEYTLSIKASVLEKSGDEESASVLRMEQINKNSRNAAFYNDEANYLLKKGKYTNALRVVAQAEERGCAIEYTLSIKASVLEKSGDEESASVLRMEQINKNSRHAAFYNDEANYLLKNGKYTDAQRVVAQAEAHGCANEYILSIKASVLEKSGDEESASVLRMEQINKNSRHAAFYNDEANYLLKKGRYKEALAVIEKAEARGCTDEYTNSIKAKIINEVMKKKTIE